MIHICTRISPTSTLCRDCLEGYYDELKASDIKLSNRVWQLETILTTYGIAIPPELDLNAEPTTEAPRPNGRRRWRDRGGADPA